MTASNAGSSATAASPASAPVFPLPPDRPRPQPRSRARPGGQAPRRDDRRLEQITTSHAYAWQRCSNSSTSTTISSTTEHLLHARERDISSTVRVLVTAANAADFEQRRLSGNGQRRGLAEAREHGASTTMARLPSRAARTLDTGIGAWTSLAEHRSACSRSSSTTAERPRSTSPERASYSLHDHDDAGSNGQPASASQPRERPRLDQRTSSSTTLSTGPGGPGRQDIDLPTPTSTSTSSRSRCRRSTSTPSSSTPVAPGGLGASRSTPRTATVKERRRQGARTRP